jgi:alpha-mannosidase
LTLTGRGAISSLIDKTRGWREFARTVGGRALNDLGPGSGTVAIENAGPASTSVRITASAPLRHTTVVTLYGESGRIDIDNHITENFGDVQTWGFGFNFDNPDTYCEEQGAILNARLSTDGGHYSPRNARYDWLSLNHFAAMTDGGASITLANADCCFARLGHSTPKVLDTATPSLSVLAGGQVDGVGLGIRNQGLASRFRQRFSLQTGSAYSPAASMRMALAFQNPIVTAAVDGRVSEPDGFDGHRFGLVHLTHPRVLLWALKPAEEGIRRGLIVRLWNLGNAEHGTRLRVGSALTDAKLTTHLETTTEPLPLDGGELALGFKPQQLRTVRVQATVPLPA